MYSLIVVDYNSVDTTAEYIHRAWKAMGKKGAGHVVIVQNGTDALDRLVELYGAYDRREYGDRTVCSFKVGEQEICYCHSGENMGYARGNNLGAEIARQVWNDPYYIISNNDLVLPVTLDLSVADKLFDADATMGVIGPQVTTPDGIQQSPQAWAPAFRRLIVDYWRRFAAAFMGGEKKARYLIKHCNDVVGDAPSGSCGWVSGCFFLTRAKAFHDAGMFDPHTFLYAEEMILSRRMETAGYKVWFCRELEVVHNHAQTTKKSISIMKGRQLDFESVWYYYKTYTKTSAILLLFAKWNFAVYKFVFNCFQKLKGKS